MLTESPGYVWMEKSALHSLSVSGEVAGARGVCVVACCKVISMSAGEAHCVKFILHVPESM